LVDPEAGRFSPRGAALPSSTAAVILAAGFSSRMGAFKPLLPLGGVTVLERLLALYQRAGVGEVLVVLGHRAEDLAGLVLAGGARPVLNPRHAEGMFSSVAAGAAALGPAAQAFFVHPVDIPLVRPATLTALLQALAQGGADLAYPIHNGRRGHPPLLAAGLAGRINTPQARARARQGGLRAVLAPFQGRALEVETPDPGILLDMDDWDGYQAVLAAAQG
jgi:CTP:molybdopterin cytidylyltransferase MocA